MKNEIKDVAKVIGAIRNLLRPNETGVSDKFNFIASRDTSPDTEEYSFERCGSDEKLTVEVTKTESGGMKVEFSIVGNLDLENAYVDLTEAKNYGL